MRFAIRRDSYSGDTPYLLPILCSWPLVWFGARINHRGRFLSASISGCAMRRMLKVLP